MYTVRFLSILLFSLFAESLFALPYVFQRAVNDTTALAPNASNVQQGLGPLLSKGATLYFPGTPQFANATSRWSAYAEPQIAVVVEPATAEDVSATVQSLQRAIQRPIFIANFYNRRSYMLASTTFHFLR